MSESVRLRAGDSTILPKIIEGLSPEVELVQESDGVLMTVITKSGTKSALIPMGPIGPQGEVGPQGETGPQGPKGDDYVLTAEDIASIQAAYDEVKADILEAAEQVADDKTAAVTAATAAAGSADSAAESASDAAENQQQTADLVESARTYMLTAQQSATDAATAASAASADKSTVQGIAATVTELVEGFDTAAGNAIETVTNAKSDALSSIADDKAAALEAIAENKADAIEAIAAEVSDAEDAAEAAETAQGKAEDAQTAAEDAKTAAEAAQEAAEAAASALSNLIDDTAGDGDTNKTWSADKLSELNSRLTSKQDAPETAGTSGQVLSLDSNLEPVWADSAPESDDSKADVIISSASGAIASFPDGMAAPAKQLIVSVEPVQEGSGDPSPDNVRPISGWEGVEVTRTGKNLFPAINGAEYSDTYLSVTCNNGEYALTLSSTGLSVSAILPNYTVDALLGNNRIIPAGTYACNISVSQWGSDTDLIPERLKIGMTDNTTGETFYIWNGQSATLAHDSTIDQVHCDRAYYMPAGAVTKFTVQLEKASTVSDYEAYKGQTYPITFPSEAGTVFGATLTVEEDGTGKLVVDRTAVDPNNWVQYNASNGYKAYMMENVPFGRYSGQSINMPMSNIISEFGAFNSSNMDRNIIQVPYNAMSTAYLALRSDIDPTTVQLSYLCTPVEYQLTALEVLETLKGVNNIWADTGDTTVTYRADTKLYIDNKLAELIAQIVNS